MSVVHEKKKSAACYAAVNRIDGHHGRSVEKWKRSAWILRRSLAVGTIAAWVARRTVVLRVVTRSKGDGDHHWWVMKGRPLRRPLQRIRDVWHGSGWCTYHCLGHMWCPLSLSIFRCLVKRDVARWIFLPTRLSHFLPSIPRVYLCFQSKSRITSRVKRLARSETSQNIVNLSLTLVDRKGFDHEGKETKKEVFLVPEMHANVLSL